MKRPEKCVYCDGNGNAKSGGECGFCDKGTPLDTQQDWDESWGRLFRYTTESLPSPPKPKTSESE